MTPSIPADPNAGAAREALGFEQLMAEIERTTAALERGELPLEEALAAFERGMAMMRDAGRVLDQAEARLARLVEGKDGALHELAMPLEPRGRPG